MILGPTLIPDPGVAAAWAASRGATPLFSDLAALFWRYAPERGVRPEVAYAQSAKETAFGRYGGVITADWRNTCGLKTREGGSNGDPNAHQRFPTWEQGIIAHLDHLALYAGALGYPKPGTPDPRHFSWLYGTAPSVVSLSGKWAGTGYGESLRDHYLNPLIDFSRTFEAPKPPEYVELERFLRAIENLDGRWIDTDERVAMVDDRIAQLVRLLDDVQAVVSRHDQAAVHLRFLLRTLVAEPS